MTALAVIVVAYNSTDDLGDTLPAVAAQLADDDELVVVDCGSSDDPGPAVAAVERARLVRLAENRGFAGGAAAGAAETSAPLLFFLNPDARPAAECLEALRAAAADHPSWGAWQALVTLPGGREVNSAGNVVHWLGFGWAGHHGGVVDAVPAAPQEVAFASGAALVVRREAWDAVGGFDPAYFMYGEDLDLSLRLRLAGLEVGLVPAARVEHGYEFEKGAYKWFWLERNRARTVLSVYPGPLLALLAPALLAFELALLVVAWRGGWLRAKLRAQGWALRDLPQTLARRRLVQARRRVRARDFAAALSAGLESPFLGPAAQQPALTAVQRTYWAAVRRVLG